MGDTGIPVGGGERMHSISVYNGGERFPSAFAPRGGSSAPRHEERKKRESKGVLVMFVADWRGGEEGGNFAEYSMERATACDARHPHG